MMQFDDEFQIKTLKVKKSFIKVNSILKLFNPKRLLNLFTVLNLITEYNFKKDLIADIFSGRLKNTFLLK